VESRVDFHDGARRLVAAARPTIENVLVFQRTDSTHAGALRLIEQAETEEIILPTSLVIAVEQDQGLGRAGRTWISPAGGLYLNWITASLDPQIIAQLPMVAAAAAHEALSRLGVEDLVVKWPNDLLVDGRKLAGVLVHARHGATKWVTVGIGINLDHAPVIDGHGTARTIAVADLVAAGDFWSWAETIVAILADELHRGAAHPDEHIARWRECLHHRPGMEIVIRRGDGSQTRGRYAGLTDEGHLRLDVDGDEHIISTGDVVE